MKHIHHSIPTPDFCGKIIKEYKKHKIIGILASLYVDESIIKRAERVGFLALAVGDQLMEVRNTKGFKPKEW